MARRTISLTSDTDNRLRSIRAKLMLIEEQDLSANDIIERAVNKGIELLEVEIELQRG